MTQGKCRACTEKHFSEEMAFSPTSQDETQLTEQKAEEVFFKEEQQVQRCDAAESLVCARSTFSHGLQAAKGSELRSQRCPAPPADACQPQECVWISFYAQHFHLGKLLCI